MANEIMRGAPYDYQHIDEGPSWHRDVAHYAMAGMDVSDIAALVGSTPPTVRKVLDHEAVQTHIRTLSLQIQVEEQKYQERLRDIVGNGLAQLLEDVKSDSTTPGQRKSIVEFAADRLSSGSMAKQTKHHELREDRHVVSIEQLNQLNSVGDQLGRSAAIDAEFKVRESPQVEDDDDELV